MTEQEQRLFNFLSDYHIWNSGNDIYYSLKSVQIASEDYYFITYANIDDPTDEYPISTDESEVEVYYQKNEFDFDEPDFMNDEDEEGSYYVAKLTDDVMLELVEFHLEDRYGSEFVN